MCIILQGTIYSKSLLQWGSRSVEEWPPREMEVVEEAPAQLCTLIIVFDNQTAQLTSVYSGATPHGH